MSSTDERWYFTKEQLENSPSRRCGIDAEKELSHRQAAANFIQDMGQRLQVTQLCINTAIVYMHRFYCFHSFSLFHRTAVAAASVFLAAKVEEQPRKLEHIIKVSQLCLQKSQPNSNSERRHEQYAEQAAELVSNENVLLMTLGFDVAIEHPHAFIVKFCHLSNANKDLAHTSYFMASQCLHLTTMCLQYKPTIVACFCIHLTCKWSNYQIPASRENLPWYTYIDPSVTEEQLEQLTQEFLVIFDKCPSRLRKKIQNVQLNSQSGSMSGSYPLEADSRRQFAVDMQLQSAQTNGQKESSGRNATAADGQKKSSNHAGGGHTSTKPTAGDRVNGSNTQDAHRAVASNPPSMQKLPNVAVKPNVSGPYPAQSATTMNPHLSHKSGGAATLKQPRAPTINPVKVTPSKFETKTEPSTKDMAIAHVVPSTVAAAAAVNHNHYQPPLHHQQQQQQQPAKMSFRKDNGLGLDAAASGRMAPSATVPSSYSSHSDIISNVVKEVAKQHEKQRSIIKTEPVDEKPSVSSGVLPLISSRPAKSHSIFSPNPHADDQTADVLQEKGANNLASDFDATVSAVSAVATKVGYDETAFRRPTTAVTPMNEHFGHRKFAPTTTVPSYPSTNVSLQTTLMLSNSMMAPAVKMEPTDAYEQPPPMAFDVDGLQQQMAIKAEANDSAPQQHAHKKKKKHKEKDKRHDKEKHHHKEKKRHKEEKHKHRKEESADREAARDPSPIKITIPKEKLTDIPKLTIRIKPDKIAAASTTTAMTVQDGYGATSEAADRLKLKLSKEKLKSSRKRNRESDSEEVVKKLIYDPSTSSSSSGTVASHNGYKF